MSHARRITFDDVKGQVLQNTRCVQVMAYIHPASVSHSYRNPIINSCRTHKTRFIFELMSTFVPSRDTIDRIGAPVSRSVHEKLMWRAATVIMPAIQSVHDANTCHARSRWYTNKRCKWLHVVPHGALIDKQVQSRVWNIGSRYEEWLPTLVPRTIHTLVAIIL